MKNIIISILACVCILLACSSNKGYNSSSSSYYEGYEDGVKHALSVLRGNSNDWDRYVKFEDVEDSIYLYYDNNPYVDADLVRDDILYHPDVENYTLNELLENLINETTLEEK